MKYSKYDEARFWSSVNVANSNDSCWYWKKSTHKFGYGYFRINKKTYLAHRVALVMFGGGENKLDKQALHSCDNPRCCNPKHLRWGNANDNIQDQIKRNRKTDPPTFYGEDHPNAKLNWENVNEIREKRSQGYTAKNLAKEYNISENGVYRVLNYSVWKVKNGEEVADGK